MVDIRDLYKKKGDQISNDIDESKKRAERLLKDNLVNIRRITPDVKKKLLQLKISKKKPLIQVDRGSLDQVSTLVISFGIMYQRLEGKGIRNNKEFLEAFNLTFNSHLSQEKYESVLKRLVNNSFVFSSEGELLFEPRSQSEDVKLILDLVSSKGKLEYQAIKESYPSWSMERIQSILNLLEQEGIMVVEDKETYWFPAFTMT